MSELCRKLSTLVGLLCAATILLSAWVTAAAQIKPVRKVTESQQTATVLNLKDFGAIGDGVADDSPALQQALDALAESGGGTLLVPSGEYALRTPVAKQFTPEMEVTIAGVPSGTAIDVAGNGVGLDLTSEFVIAVGPEADALSLSDLGVFLMADVSFLGVMPTPNDARRVLELNNIRQATVRHCEFYGLASMVPGGAILQALGCDLRLEQTAFLGCATNSGVTTSMVQNFLWLGITITDCKFIDYGNRPDFFSKTPFQSPYSWINIGIAANPQPTWPRREAVIKHVFLDEGGYFAITARPELGSPEFPPYEVYLSRLRVNVTNLASDGIRIYGAKKVFIDQSHFGWSHNAGFAINLDHVGEAILDLIDCTDDATRLNVDAQRLAVINSNNTSLESTAPFTRVIQTETPEADPVQYVRQQYVETLKNEPDPAGQFYWADQILRCDGDAGCVNQAKAALAAYLAVPPPPRFSLSGNVADENGAPLSGVAVSVTGTQAISMTSDSLGNFAFTDLPTAGSYVISGSKPHYSFQSQTLVTPTSNQTVELSGTLARHSITGRIFRDTGQPLPGAILTLTSGEEEESTTSDGNGDYSFPDLPAGADYLLTVSCEHYSFDISSRSFPNLSADIFAVFQGTLLRYSISGRMINADGSPLNGITMVLLGSQDGTAVTNQHGDYSFDNLPATGNFTITPTNLHYTFSPAQASIQNLTADKTQNFSATLNRLAIGGRVFAHTGRVLTNAVVTLTGAEAQSAISDANGDFFFTDLPAGGDYTVSVSRNNYDFSVASQTYHDLVTNQYIAFEGVLRNYTISGQVMRQSSAGSSVPSTTPLSGALIQITGGFPATTLTDASGNYSLTVPGDGSYTITAARINYVFTPASRSFTVLSANQTVDFVGELVDYVVSGSVVTNEGSQLSGVTINVSGTETRSIITTRDEGFALNLEAEGDYTITPSKPNYTFSPASISVNALAGDRQSTFVATLNPGVPLILEGIEPDRALAIDAVLQTVEPFKPTYGLSWGTDNRTRVMLFARHFDLAAGEGVGDVTVTAEDEAHRIYPLTVEWAGKVNGSDWLMGVVVRLDSNLTNLGDVLVRITHHGLTSDPMRMGLGHLGDPTQ